MEERHPSLAAILKRMLSEQPEERWPSLSDVTLQLARIECEAVVLAKNSYRDCCLNRLEFWKAFYLRLFSMCPELRQLFGNREMDAQYRILDVAVQSLLNVPSMPVVEPTVLSVTAAQHRRLDLEQRHYELFGEALIDTLRNDGKQPEKVLSAWRSTIAPGLEYMKRHSGISAELRPAISPSNGAPAAPDRLDESAPHGAPFRTARLPPIKP
jgi:hemoglobin-like flavoprotein